jgi:hypothetical protein
MFVLYWKGPRTMRQQFPISQHSGVWQCRGTRWSISKPRNEISAALAPRCATFLPAARRRGGRAAALHSAVARVASWTAQDDGAACTPRHRSAGKARQLPFTCRPAARARFTWTPPTWQRIDGTRRPQRQTGAAPAPAPAQVIDRREMG